MARTALSEMGAFPKPIIPRTLPELEARRLSLGEGLAATVPGIDEACQRCRVIRVVCKAPSSQSPGRCNVGKNLSGWAPGQCPRWKPPT